MRIVVAAGLSLLLGLSLPAQAGSRHRHSDRMVSFDERGSSPLDCSALEVRLDGKKVEVHEERIAIPAGEILNVRVREHGGLYVQPGSGSGYTARLCKAAKDASELPSIRPSLDGRSLTVNGPTSDDDWVAYLIVDAPADASMSLESDNAPISLKRVRGSFVAKATNGPISIEDTEGTIDAATQNGPIALTGSQGDVKLRARNGPIAVELEHEWRGKGLDARTENGPVALTVSSSFRSGVVVESEGHSPFACDGPSCDGWKIDGHGRGRTYTLGTSPALVRLSTSNGPVAISSPEQ